MAMLLTMAPTVAFATEGDVAKIGEQTYATLDDAIAAAEEGATIELLGDATTAGMNLSKALTIQAAEGLSEKPTVTFTDKGIALLGKALNFKNVDVVMNGIGSTPYTAEWNWMTICASVNASLTLDNVYMTMDASGTTNSPHAIYFCNNNVLNIQNGSNLTIKNYANDALEWDGGNGGYNVNITDSTFISDHNRSGFTGTFGVTAKNSLVKVINSTGNGSNGSHFKFVDCKDENKGIYFNNNGSHGLSAADLSIENSTVEANDNGMYGITYTGSMKMDGASKVYVNRNALNNSGGGLRANNVGKNSIVNSGSVMEICNNGHNGLENYGTFTFEAGVNLTITGNDERTTNGGGIYNGGTLTLPENAVITNNHAFKTGGGICNAGTVTVPANVELYNNHAGNAGDDIYNRESATITFGEVGSDWKLDGDPDCEDAIDGWYDDSADERWEAHTALYHAEKFTEFENGSATVTGLKALKAAHGQQSVEPDPDPEPPVVNWEKSKSKTATNLDSNYESKVTLSLPAADYEPEIDVVFVIDDTSATSAIFAESAKGLLDELRSKENLDINFGLVTFDAIARDWLEVTSDGAISGLVSLSDNDNYTAICKAIETTFTSGGEGKEKRLGGTNTEWPIAMAQEMLAEGTGSEKHVIMFSDMYGYVYRGDLTVGETTYENVPLSKRLGSYDYGQLCISPPKYATWEEVYNNRTDDDASLDTFFRDGSWDNYWEIYADVNSVPGIGQAPKNSAPQYEPGSNPPKPFSYFTPFEKSSCLTYDGILKLMQNDIQVTIVNNNFDPGSTAIQQIKNEMLTDLANKGVTLIREDTDNSEPFSTEQMKNVFATLEDKLIQVVDAGSKVVDEIGSGTDNHSNPYNFDFVDDIDKLELTVNGEALAKAKVAAESGETARYNFGTAEDPDQFVLHYYQNGTTVGEKTYGECFVWDINVPVTKEAPVQLTYTVKLTDPQEAEGTYGQYDADGSENYSGLYTNNSATLYPVDSNGQDGTPENFAKPTVSYTVGTITVTPADITIYMGGDDGYDAVVGGEDAATGTVTSANSLPRPMFLIDAPEDVDPTQLVFTSNEQLTDEDGEPMKDESGNPLYKTWTLTEAGKTSTDESTAKTLYYMNAKYADQGQDEVRVQFTEQGVEGAKPIVSDAFDPAQKNEMFVDYDIELYTNTVTVGNITVTDSEGNSYKLGTLGTGTLRVRAVDDTENNNNPVTPVAASITAPVKAGEGAVTAPAGTTYTLNDTTVEVEADGVGLLFDGIIDDEAHDRTGALEDKVDEEMGPAASNVTRHYQAQYLDLVDADNGNAWVKASDNVTVYWGYPSGTDKNTKFTLYHFEGLHRDNSSGGSSGFDIDDIDANTTKLSEVKNIAKGDNGISFEVGSGGFSPFVLVWETTNSGGGGGGGGHHDKPEDLNTEDHFAYIIGYPGGTVQPQGDITRAEVATIFFRMLTDEARAENWSQTNNYTDVAPADWYNNAISTLTNMGIISGEPDGSFRPNDPITRAEFTKIAVGFFEEAGNYVEGTFVDVPANAWYADFIDAAVDLGLIEGYPDGTIRPEATITRAEACTIVNRTLGRVPDKDHLLPEEDMVLWPDNSDVNAWYYAQMQEATNSHDYEWTGEGDEQVENWTEKLEDRDWDALETEWSEAGDAPGGEVMD